MIFPIRPIATEIRRVDDVSVRATPAVTGITAVRGFNQPGVVVTIGDGARTLARSGQQPQSGAPAQDARTSSATQDDSLPESVFAKGELDAGVETVFNDDRGKALLGSEPDEAERSSVEEEESFKSVWETDTQGSDEVNASGVPYAALQRAASVQDLDVGDVAQALAHTQIAVRVLATQDKLAVNEVSEDPEAEEVVPDADAAEPSRLSTVPTDGVPYEALQRAVTEAENAQSDEPAEVNASLTEPIFMPPENGGAPYGRAVPFEDDVMRSVTVDRVVSPRRERPSEVHAHA